MISVIMLTYNREKYVKRAVESILCQTYNNFEFIIVNNGSEDNSGLICEDFTNKDKRIRVIHKEKGNIGSGRNAGLLAAKGKYITFIDDDDTAEPDMIEFLYNLIKEYNADISICGSWRSTDGIITPKYIYKNILILDTEQAIIELLKREYYNVTFPCKLIKRELLLPPPFSEDGCYDDVTTTHKVFAEAKRIVAHGEPKYTFFRHNKNNSIFTIKYNLLTPDILNEYLAAYKERSEYLLKRFPRITDYIRYSEWSFMISMCEKIKRYKLNYCKVLLDAMKEELKKNKDYINVNIYLKDFEKDWFNEIIKNTEN